MIRLNKILLIAILGPLSYESTASTSYVRVGTALESIIGENPVRALHRDENGDTWVALQSGLHKLEDNFLSRPDAYATGLRRVIANEIISLASDADGRLYALSSRDGIFVNASNENATAFKALERKENTLSYGRHLEMGSNGILGAQYDGKIEFLRGSSALTVENLAIKTKSLVPSTKLVSTNDFGFCAAFDHEVLCNLLSRSGLHTRVFESTDGADILGLQVLGDRAQIFVVTEDHKGLTVPISGIGDRIQFDLAGFALEELRSIQQHKDNILIATSRSILALNLTTKEQTIVPTTGLARITGLTIDGQGFWALTEKGVTYYTVSHSITWAGPNPASPIEVLSFAADDRDRVFIGSHEGLTYWNRRDNEFQPVILGDSQTNDDMAVTAIGLDNSKILVGSFRDGLEIFTLSKNRPYRLIEGARVMQGMGITTIEDTSAGFLVGTFKSGLKQLINQKVKDISMPTAWRQSPSPITSITSIPKTDDILVSTENDLYILCLRERTPFICNAKNLSGRAGRPRILATAIDSRGVVWLGTLNHGLLSTRVKDLFGEKEISIEHHPEVAAASVYSVLSSSTGVLWAATNDGIFSIRNGTPTIQRLGKFHGLSNMDFNHGASALLSDGSIIFGGRFGFDLLDGNTVPTISEFPKIWLKEVSADSSTFSYKAHLNSLDQIRINNTVRKIEFLFTVNDFRATINNTYEYKLQGFDDRWQNGGNSNVATYTNIPPGRYTFRAKGANATGNWSENEIALEVLVLPPVWRSWWAIASYGLLVAFALMLIKRLNDRSVIGRERLRLAEAGAAAYARLEDDYQEQREANERLLLSRKAAALSLLEVVEITFEAQDAQISNQDQRSIAILEKLTTLKHLQELTTRSTTAETTDLHALTNEIGAELAARHELAARAIISNAVTSGPLPLEHAIFLCLTIHESLRLAVLGRDYNSDEEPLVLIDLNPPTLLESGEYRYDLLVTDSALPAANESIVEAYLPLTLHLIESQGGDVRESYEAGNRLQIQLQFGAQSPAPG